jgi:extracellular factor (EF) 3-hydroxypalmitic acid methyl ester biosynthesis protein
METAKNNPQLIDTNIGVSPKEKAFLIHGTDQIPIYAEKTSKYSLSFRYLNRWHQNESDEPVRLLVRNNGDSVELGPCRIIEDTKIKGTGGRLIFTKEVYDFESLLRRNKILKLQTPFSNLSVIMAQKDTIRSTFKEYTADLNYELSVYKNIFDDVDSQYRKEKEEIRRYVQEAIFNSEGESFKRFLDEKLYELQQIVSDYSFEEHQYHGFYFRRQLWHFIQCSALIARTNLKPRGYAGDSKMMKMIYLNEYLGNSTFSKLMHKHAVEHPAAQSVRNRIELIADLLRRYRFDYGFSQREKLKILSVGSGPAIELQEVLKSPPDCEKYHFTLLDQDPLALSEASALVNEIEKRLKSNVSVGYFESSVRTMLFARKFHQKMGQFHFIYSMGLFDYLAAPVAKAVIDNLYRLLVPGGMMVIGNFHVSNPSAYYMEYWCDWVLYQRTEEEFKGLLKDNHSADVSVLFENTGSQMFLQIKRLTDS